MSLSSLVLDGWTNAQGPGRLQAGAVARGRTSPTATSGWTTVGAGGVAPGERGALAVLEAGSYILRINPVSVAQVGTGQFALTSFVLDGEVLTDTDNGGVGGGPPSSPADAEPRAFRAG